MSDRERGKDRDLLTTGSFTLQKLIINRDESDKARNSIGASPVGGRNPNTWAVNRTGALARSWTGSRAAGTRSDGLIWAAGIAGGGFTRYATCGPPKFYFLCLSTSKRDGGRAPFPWLSLQRPAAAGADSGQHQQLRMPCGCPPGCQRPGCQHHHLLPSWVHTGGKLELSIEAGLKPRQDRMARPTPGPRLMFSKTPLCLHTHAWCT